MHPRPQFEMPGLPAAPVNAPPEVAGFPGEAMPGDRVVRVVVRIRFGVVVGCVAVVRNGVGAVVGADVETGDTVNKIRIK